MDHTIAVNLENEYVLKALEEEAGRHGITVAELIAAIVEDWFDDLFLEEDLRAVEQAKRESLAAIPWEDVKKRFRQRKKVAS